MPTASFSQTNSDEMDALLDDVGNAKIQLDIRFQPRATCMTCMTTKSPVFGGQVEAVS